MYKSHKTKLEKRCDLLRLWQKEDRLLAVQSSIRLSPVILFQNLESYEVKTKRDFKDFYSISGSQNFLSSGKKKCTRLHGLEIFHTAIEDTPIPRS